jgi:hypothetical protein
MTQSSKAHAYSEGLHDRESGKPRDANPYPPHIVEYYLWEVGWLAGITRSKSRACENNRDGDEALFRPSFNILEFRQNLHQG